MKLVKRFVFIAMICALPSGFCFAEFDSSTLVTRHGQILSVEEYALSTQPEKHTYVLMRDLSGSQLTIDLGPTWYLNAEGMELEPHTAIVVEGYLVDIEGTPFIFASKVTTAGETLVLRYPDGSPIWRGSRRGYRARRL